MLLALVLALSPARADIPPPRGYVEGCSVATQCRADAEGTTCSASFEGRADCEKLEAEGWVRACKTRGASVWTEVLCRGKGGDTPPTLPEVPAPAPDAPPTTPAATPPPATPPTQGSGRCGPPTGASLVWLAGVLALAMRRRAAT